MCHENIEQILMSGILQPCINVVLNQMKFFVQNTIFVSISCDEIQLWTISLRYMCTHIHCWRLEKGANFF